MSTLDSDDNFVSFGTSLDPIEEEDIARKKPMTIGDQIATDERGRRRFHGAFTGGFSAGYFNTVGSKEGWTPSTFKSSRNERSAIDRKGQNVTDYMDDEDIGAFGIAPQVLRPSDSFASSENKAEVSRKRTKPAPSDGPIPGVPVLHQIIEPVRETIGVRILIKMGWRHGQGIGPRISKKKKLKDKNRKDKSSKGENLDDIEKPTIVEQEMEIEKEPEKRIYGCQLPADLGKKSTGTQSDDESSEEEFDTGALYAPEDVDSPLCNPKVNVFGLGYKGLDRGALSSSTGHVDLFGNQLKFKVGNQKMNITGEAFGIGAFEEPDEDVYSREDLSQYDFELETMEDKKTRRRKETLEKAKKKQCSESIDGFRRSKGPGVRRKFFPPPHLPPNFEPVHAKRKSRFETSSNLVEEDHNKRGLGRHALTVQERQVLLGEESTSNLSSDKVPASNQSPSAVPHAAELHDQPHQSVNVESSQDDPSVLERVERIKKFVQVLQTHSLSASAASTEAISGSDKPVFKPFLKNPEKQDRYEKYMTLLAAGFQYCLKELQPPGMTEWERERERSEFERASAIYKPLSGVMSSRFVSAKSHDISHVVPEKELMKEKDPTEDPKVAARMNLFGKLTHQVVEWHPDKIVCRRFNIKDPYPDSKFVGLRGQTSTKTDSPVTFFQPQPTNPVSNVPETPKRSLFDNLDFSKPPPGLLPPSQAISSGGEPPPPGTSIEAPEPGSGSDLETKKLDFQPNALMSSSEEKENIPMKAPLDLFKEIFADSSEEDSEDEIEGSKITSTPVLSNGEEETRARRNDFFTAKSGSSRDKEPVKTTTRKKDSGTAEGKRGIFDGLDLTRLDNINKDVNEDEDELSYGPKALKNSDQGSITNSRPLPQPPQSFTRNLNNTAETSKSIFSKRSESLLVNTKDEDEVVWVEKESEVSHHKKKSKHTSVKKSKKSKSKKEKEKSKRKEKKSSKKHKHKKSKSKKAKSGLSRSSSPSSSSKDKDKGKSDDSSDDSSSSITIYNSLDQKALLAQLKQIAKSK